MALSETDTPARIPSHFIYMCRSALNNEVYSCLDTEAIVSQKCKRVRSNANWHYG